MHRSAMSRKLAIFNTGTPNEGFFRPSRESYNPILQRRDGLGPRLLLCCASIARLAAQTRFCANSPCDLGSQGGCGRSSHPPAGLASNHCMNLGQWHLRGIKPTRPADMNPDSSWGIFWASIKSGSPGPITCEVVRRIEKTEKLSVDGAIISFRFRTRARPRSAADGAIADVRT